MTKLLLLTLLSFSLFADALSGEVEKQALNISAIVMFVLFVGATLVITYWAAKRTSTASDFYTAGGGITGFQNGLAIAGDYIIARNSTITGSIGVVFISADVSELAKKIGIDFTVLKSGQFKAEPLPFKKPSEAVKEQTRQEKFQELRD